METGMDTVKEKVKKNSYCDTSIYLIQKEKIPKAHKNTKIITI